MGKESLCVGGGGRWGEGGGGGGRAKGREGGLNLHNRSAVCNQTSHGDASS